MIVVTLFEETVQTAGEFEVNAMARPEVALAVSANVEGEKLFVPGLAKLMVWLALTTFSVKDCTAAGMVVLDAVNVSP